MGSPGQPSWLRSCTCLSTRCPAGASHLSELQAILVLGDFEFMSVKHFILLKLLDPLK